MRLVPRLLPTVIAVSAVMLTVKVGALWHDAGVAFAQQPAPAAAPGDKGPDKAASGPAPADSDQPDAAKTRPPQKFTPAEIEVLGELSKRREELDKRSEDLDRRDLLMKAAEQRVDEKIAELKQLQTQVDASLGQMKQEDDDRLKSLVHIYETMKPQEAATIFEGMDMPSLIGLLSRMKDLKTAPILAAMAPDKARAVTVALAQRKEISDPKAN